MLFRKAPSRPNGQWSSPCNAHLSSAPVPDSHRTSLVQPYRATRLHILSSKQKNKAVLSKDNTTVFLVPTPVRTQRCSSGSIFVGILAHALGSKSSCACCSAFPGFPSDRITPRTARSCAYSNGQSSGLTAEAVSPDFLIIAPAKRQLLRMTRSSILIFRAVDIHSNAGVPPH